MYQLRIYEVDPDKRGAFHDRFEHHAAPIMRKYGFEIVAMWESTSAKNFEFVYMLQWPDQETMERQWDLFLADEEWVEVKRKMDKDIGEPVARVTSRTLQAVEYSPTSEAPPNHLPTYRLITGPDDDIFCKRVSEALALGYVLYGSPSVAFDGESVIAAQAIIWPSIHG